MKFFKNEGSKMEFFIRLWLTSSIILFALSIYLLFT